MSKFWVVALETYRRNVKSVGFIVMILTPFLILGIGGIFGYLMNQSDGDKNIAIITSEDAYRTTFIQNQTSYKVDKKIKTEEAAKTALQDEKIDAYFVVTQKDALLTGKLYITSSGEEQLETVLTQQLSSIQSTMVAQRLNLSNQDLSALSTPAVVQSQTLKFDGDKVAEEKDSHNTFMEIGVTITSFFIFMFIMNYSSIIGQEIASEKGTRIMEIILSSTKASTHFYGKLLGILLVCLTQIAAYVAIGVGTYFGTRNLEFVQELLADAPIGGILKGLLGYNLAFFILGIIAYASVSAFLGSLVTKTEDVAKSVQPIMFLGIAGFYVGIFLGITNPEHIAVKVCSYIPFLSSFVMPFRVASDTVSTFGVIISLVILLITTLFLTFLSATLYRSNVLIYSDGGLWKSFKQSLSILKNEKQKAL